MNLEQFKRRYGKVNKPEDVDASFGLDNLVKTCVYNGPGDFDDWAWIDTIPPQFYTLAENVTDQVGNESLNGKEEFCVKVYELLLFTFQNPEIFFPSDGDFPFEQEQQIESNESQSNFFNKSHSLPKHVIDILEVCGNHVVKPIGDNPNLFTYLHVESLAEEIQAIIDEYKQGN